MTPEPTELHTERLLLRPFRPTDVEDVVAYANDEQWARYLFSNVP
jgi:RimJ/RimL family protein N-acetyltransferase